MADRVIAGEGDKASRLIAGGEADVVLLGRPPRDRIKGPRGRPIHADIPTAHPNDPEGKTAYTWEKVQASLRKIEVVVISTPMEGFSVYYCAKRAWPKGQTRALVSPAELEELEAEEGRIQVFKAEDIGKQVVVAAEVRSTSGDMLTAEVATMPDIKEPPAAPPKRK